MINTHLALFCLLSSSCHRLFINQQSKQEFRSFAIPFNLYEDYAPSHGFYCLNNCQKLLVSSFRVENFKQILFLKILLKDGSSHQKLFEKIKFLHQLFQGFFPKIRIFLSVFPLNFCMFLPRKLSMGTNVCDQFQEFHIYILIYCYG